MMSKHNTQKTWPWVAAAVVLLMAAGWLAWSSQKTTDAIEGRKKIERLQKELPSFPRTRKVDRSPVALAPLATERIQNQKHAVDDPLLRALTAVEGDGAQALVEWQTMVQSPLAQKLMKCSGNELQKGLNELQKELGIHALDDIDRIGGGKELMVLSGNFQDFKAPPNATSSSYGDGAQLYSMGNASTMAKLGPNVMLVGDSAKVKDAIDRMEGRTPSETSFVPMSGELNGLLSKEALSGFLGAPLGDNPASLLQKALGDAAIRMNVTDDVALSFDLQPQPGVEAADLQRMLDGVVSYARRQAEQQADSELLWMLETAQSKVQEGTVAFDVALPGAFLLKAMNCDSEGNRIQNVEDPVKNLKDVDVPVVDSAQQGTQHNNMDLNSTDQIQLPPQS